MGKSALPSLAASVLLHVALPLGIGGQVLSGSRASLLPSRATEFELVPDPALFDEVSIATLATRSATFPPVAERAAPRRRSAAPSAPVLPAPPLSTASAVSDRTSETAASPSAESPSAESPRVESPSVESQPARESTESAVVAAPERIVTPRVAVSSSVVAEPGTPPSSGTATGAALAASGVAARGVASLATGASSSSSGPAVGSGDTERASRAAYLQELRGRVLVHRVYPYQARRARLEGTVCLRVSLNGQGEVVRLQATCGAPEALLEAAFAAVRTAAPFGPLPSPLRELTLDLPMVFQLEAL